MDVEQKIDGLVVTMVDGFPKRFRILSYERKQIQQRMLFVTNPYAFKINYNGSCKKDAEIYVYIPENPVSPF